MDSIEQARTYFKVCCESSVTNDMAECRNLYEKAYEEIEVKYKTVKQDTIKEVIKLIEMHERDYIDFRDKIVCDTLKTELNKMMEDK